MILQSVADDPAWVLHASRSKLWCSFGICLCRSSICLELHSSMVPASGHDPIFLAPYHYLLSFLACCQLCASNPIRCSKHLEDPDCAGNYSVSKCSSSNLTLVRQPWSKCFPIQPKQYILIRVDFVNLRFESNSSWLNLRSL